MISVLYCLLAWWLSSSVPKTLLCHTHHHYGYQNHPKLLKSRWRLCPVLSDVVHPLYHLEHSNALCCLHKVLHKILYFICFLLFFLFKLFKLNHHEMTMLFLIGSEAYSISVPIPSPVSNSLYKYPIICFAPTSLLLGEDFYICMCTDKYTYKFCTV